MRGNKKGCKPGPVEPVELDALDALLAREIPQEAAMLKVCYFRLLSKLNNYQDYNLSNSNQTASSSLLCFMQPNRQPKARWNYCSSNKGPDERVHAKT